MENLKSGPVIAALTFVVTLTLVGLFLASSSTEKELTLTFNNPVKIEAPDVVAYSLDLVDGQARDLTFRCNTSTGEGYFSLKSKDLTWASSHCQDMVGAVRDIEEKKKPSATITVTKASNQVVYRVQRN